MRLQSGLAALALLTGCARAFVANRHPSTSHDGQARLDVPFFEDHTDQCGPSSLGSVLAYWGRPVSKEKLGQEVYDSHMGGALAIDMLNAARAHGMSAEILPGELDEIKREVRSGHPVIALVDIGYSWRAVDHFLVVTGFDDERGGLIVHSGRRRNTLLSYARFLRQWEKTDRWAMRVVPERA